jgi:hypothetical protein
VVGEDADTVESNDRIRADKVCMPVEIMRARRAG